MRVAVYARVSTTRQAQAQTIEQQLDRLREAAAGHGWELEERHVYRDDGYSGARLGRPGLDRLRDHAALADLDLVLVTAPDRLARNYVHQVLLIDELAGRGCQVEFLDRPMSSDPHDQLLHQIWTQRDRIDKFDRVLTALAKRAGVDPEGTGLRSDDPIWTAAIPAARPVYDLQQDAIKLLGNMAVQYVRLGYESRELELKENMADMFLFAISRVLEQLNLTGPQRRQAPRVVEEAVKLLEAA